MVRVLLVGEDADTRRLLRNGFELHGFTVLEAESGDRGLRVATFSRPGLIILAGDSPGFDGADILDRIRSWSDVPIVVLSSVADESEKVRLLRLGADDYVVKPFATAEVVARIRAVLRRGRGKESSRGELTVADLRIDLGARRVWRGPQELSLSRKEFDLLVRLAQDAGRVVTRESLMSDVWDMNWFGSTKTLDVHVAWLRRKLGDDPAAPLYIHTVRGVGFRLGDSAGAQP